jgi:hypothetical protein
VLLLIPIVPSRRPPSVLSSWVASALAVDGSIGGGTGSNGGSVDAQRSIVVVSNAAAMLTAAQSAATGRLDGDDGSTAIAMQ